jgi:hypothetical protein
MALNARGQDFVRSWFNFYFERAFVDHGKSV